jgi:hypothetical protein
MILDLQKCRNSRHRLLGMRQEGQMRGAGQFVKNHVRMQQIQLDPQFTRNQPVAAAQQRLHGSRKPDQTLPQVDVSQ